MSGASLAGWALSGALAMRCAARERSAARRLDAVGDAEHELRGALTAFGLGLERLSRDPVGRRLGFSLASELDRARAALGDLAEARKGHASGSGCEPLALDRLARSAAAAWQPAARAHGRRVLVDWRAGPVRVRGDRGRLAQALGNLLSNAVEHGTGPIRIQATRVGGRVRIEVVNGLGHDRGRGLRIATRAVEDCGGTLALERAGGQAAAAVELPLAS